MSIDDLVKIVMGKKESLRDLKLYLQNKLELKENDAQGIDVRCRGLGRAPDLFGAGIVRSQQAFLRPGLVRRRVQDFGDAEIEQLRFAGRVHQDVGGLEIAVKDQVAMRVGNSFANP